jgi:hypothetical protein
MLNYVLLSMVVHQSVFYQLLIDQSKDGTISVIRASQNKLIKYEVIIF